MRQSTKRRIAARVQKPDSTRLRVLGVNNAPGAGLKHSPRRLVWATVVNHGKVYPYNSVKRGWLPFLPHQDAMTPRNSEGAE